MVDMNTVWLKEQISNFKLQFFDLLWVLPMHRTFQMKTVNKNGLSCASDECLITC